MVPTNDGFGFMFRGVSGIVVVGFVLVFVLIFVRMVKGGIQWNRNNHSPVLTVDAKVVTKRMAVSNYSHHGDDMTMSHTSSSTTYYVTFEVESGDRMEFRTPDEAYGMLVEGDIGRLTFQGTRYMAFERNR